MCERRRQGKSPLFVGVPSASLGVFGFFICTLSICCNLRIPSVSLCVSLPYFCTCECRYSHFSAPVVVYSCCYRCRLLSSLSLLFVLGRTCNAPRGAYIMYATSRRAAHETIFRSFSPILRAHISPNKFFRTQLCDFRAQTNLVGTTGVT